MPEIPLNLTDIDDERLMLLFSRYVAWHNFVAVRRTFAEIDEADAETALKVAEASALVETWTGDKTDRVTVSKAERDLTPEVQEAQRDYNYKRAHRKMLSVLVENMERATALVSRELTRRVGRDPYQRRNDRWQP